MNWHNCEACGGWGHVGLWPSWNWLRRLFPRLDYYRPCAACDGYGHARPPAIDYGKLRAPRGGSALWYGPPTTDPPEPPPRTTKADTAADRDSSRRRGPKTMTNGAVTEVFAAGSTVYVGGDIEAKVLAVMLDDSAVTYKCVWWSEKERKESWLHACEVTADAETPKKQIGFIPQYVQDVR